MLHPTDIIQQFQLLPHPEGGWYKETYRSTELLEAHQLPQRFGGQRSMATAIYFLLEQGNFSAFHKIKSDECWHFYAGQGLDIYVLDENGVLTITRLGNNIAAGECFQLVVPANHWFASKPATDSSFSFVGCTVAPGFDFLDFELADANTLSAQYPQHQQCIYQLCR
jgi:predicted cupin superfamily sugar epimerase